MKIVHIVAMPGNSGECLNHTAFQDSFRKLVDADVQFDEVNLRDFYKNNRVRSFDANFSKIINHYDAFVLGGGLMLDVRWTYSATGTTLNFTHEFIDSINVPVILNGIGYAEPPVFADPIEQRQIFDKFKDFIEYISEKQNWLLTLRNDGSYERILMRFGEELANRFLVVPDNGFYFDESKVIPYQFEEQKRTIGICLANDSFTPVDGYETRREEINRSISKFIEQLIDENCRILLLPHMPKDLEAIYRLYQLLGEKAFRYHIAIAPYNNLDKLSISSLVSYYKACHCIIATRFHSSIIPIICKIPVVALAAESLICPERIIALYQELGLSDFCIKIPVGTDNVEKLLYQQYKLTMANRDQFYCTANNVMNEMNKKRKLYFSKIKAFLSL